MNFSVLEKTAEKTVEFSALEKTAEKTVEFFETETVEFAEKTVEKKGLVRWVDTFNFAPTVQYEGEVLSIWRPQIINDDQGEWLEVEYRECAISC